MQDNIPYVVSADIQILLRRWAENNGFVLPPSIFFKLIRNEYSSFMRDIFPGFELVEEEELGNGIQSLTSCEELPLISFDRVYLSADMYIDVARDIEGKLWSKQEASLIQQFWALREQGLREVSLIDDVVFSGFHLERIILLLKRMGIAVPIAYAGISIQEGIQRVQQLGTNVRCVRYYGEVIDEICERDFFPGVPLCGRLLQNDHTTGAPYLLPFGDPVRWASVPTKWQHEFSRFFIALTIEVFEAIEHASRRYVTCLDLERNVVGLPKDNSRFVTALRTLL